MLSPLASLLLHYADPSQTLGILLSVIKHSSSSKTWGYATLSLKDTFLFTLVFIDFAKSLLPRLAAHLSKIPDSASDWVDVWLNLFDNLFVGHLPLPSVFRILDSYFLEGFKVLYRFGLGTLKILENELCALDSVALMSQAIKQYLTASEGRQFEELHKHAFALKIDRTSIGRTRFRLLSAASQMLTERSNFTSHHTPELSEPSEIIEEADLHFLWPHIPQRSRLLNLELLYSTRAHGHSLARLYDKSDVAPTFLFIQTMTKERFGAYLSHSWSSRALKKYFGNGECLLFRLGDNAAAFPWVGLRGHHHHHHSKDSTDQSPSDHPKGKTREDFFMLGDASSLVVGGGG